MKAKVKLLENSKSKVKAFVSVEHEGITINDIKVIDGKDGLFISMPTRSYESDGETKYVNIVYVNDEDLFGDMTETVLKAYKKAVRKGD